MESSYEEVNKSPSRVLIVYADGSSEVFEHFVVVALRRQETIPHVMEITMETVIKLPSDLSTQELLAFACSANDTIVRIITGDSMKQENVNENGGD